VIRDCHRTKWVKVGNYKILCSDIFDFIDYLEVVDLFFGLDKAFKNQGNVIALPIGGGFVDSKVVDVIESVVRQGYKVGFGCLGGHGRTGYVLGELIHRIEKFEKSPDLVKEVRNRWFQEAVETEAQIQALDSTENPVGKL